MPTLNYTPDNTPPTGIALPSTAWSNGAPTAIALAATAGTGASPVGVTINQTPDNTPPVAHAIASAVPSNAAPVGVPLDLAGTATPPTGIALASTVQSNAAPVGVPLDQSGTGTPPTGIALPSSAQSNAAPTAVALSSTTGTNSVPQQIGYAPIVPSPTDITMHTAALNFVGRLALDQVFGLYKAPAAAVILGVQLSAQTPPTGADVIITLVDADGISLARTATLPAGDAYAAVTFGTPLPVLNAAIVRAKITQIGAGEAGGYLTANLVVQLT